MRKKQAKPAAAPSDEVLRDRIVQAVVSQVPFDGWTETSYAEALRQMDVPRVEADELFPRGLRDVVERFGAMADEAMQQRIARERGFERFRVRDKITFAARTLLEHLAPHREAVRRMMIWYALPQHAVAGMKRFYATVDAIWRAAGDTSTDYNFYTKRILLAGVLKATILFWLSDETPGHSATWDFLDRRIGDVMKLGKSISLLKEFRPGEIVDMIRDKIGRVI